VDNQIEFLITAFRWILIFIVAWLVLSFFEVDFSRKGEAWDKPTVNSITIEKHHYHYIQAPCPKEKIS
jgi:hypothetical protein